MDGPEREDANQMQDAEAAKPQLIPVPLNGESITLPLENQDEFKHPFDPEKEKSRAEIWVLRFVVRAVVLSPLAVLASFYFLPGKDQPVMDVYEKWLAILGPILGAAVGFGASARSKS